MRAQKRAGHVCAAIMAHANCDTIDSHAYIYFFFLLLMTVSSNGGGGGLLDSFFFVLPASCSLSPPLACVSD